MNKDYPVTQTLGKRSALTESSQITTQNITATRKSARKTQEKICSQDIVIEKNILDQQISSSQLLEGLSQKSYQNNINLKQVIAPLGQSNTQLDTALSLFLEQQQLIEQRKLKNQQNKISKEEAAKEQEQVLYEDLLSDDNEKDLTYQQIDEQSSNKKRAKTNSNEKRKNKIKKEKVLAGLSQEKTELLKELSENFSMPYDAFVKQHGLTFFNNDDNISAIKMAYHRRRNKLYPKKQVNNQQEIEQSQKDADPMVMDLFNPILEQSTRQELAILLQGQLSQTQRSQFASSQVAQAVSMLQVSDNIIKDIIEVPYYIRIKVIAQVLPKDLDDPNQRLKWFNKCFYPTLQQLQIYDYALNLDCSEVELFTAQLFSNNIRIFSDDEALFLVKLLVTYDQLNMDTISYYFKEKNEIFWRQVLFLADYQAEHIQNIILENKSTMITNDFYQFCIKSAPQDSFYVYVAKFQKMQLLQYTTLNILSQKRNFLLLINMLDNQQKHSFTLFETVVQSYIDMENKQQTDQLKKVLQSAPLSTWLDYVSVITNAANFSTDFCPNSIVENALRAQQQTFEYSGESVIKQISKTFDSCKQVFQAQTKLSPYDWQEQLIMQIYPVINQGNNLMVQLDTGHGKSVIIQMVADMLARQDHRVIIVCLNEFLALWGRFKFATKESKNKQLVKYVSLKELQMMSPDSDAILICDEIDQMLLGTDSFRIEEDKCYNLASQMLQWKAVLGLSGTLTKSILDFVITSFGANIQYITIPSLRAERTQNQLVEVMPVRQQYLNAAIYKKIKELRTAQKSAIIICRDSLQAQQIEACLKKDKFPEQVYLFINLNERNEQTNNQIKLSKLQGALFVAITDQHGCVGMDFKSTNSSYVIFAYPPLNSTQLVQGLGRGCRNLQGYSEGSIICENPLTELNIQYQEMLELKDTENISSLETNTIIAKMLHGQQLIESRDYCGVPIGFGKGVHDFQKMLRTFDDFKIWKNEQQAVWRFLKQQIDLPDNPFVLKSK